MAEEPHVVLPGELQLVSNFLETQLPASLKLHGETQALLHGSDVLHGQGDDLVMSPAGRDRGATSGGGQ